MKNNLSKQIEIIANVYVAKVMRVCAAFAVLAIVLNAVGVFKVDPKILISSCLASILILLVPSFILFVLKKNEWWFKYVAIISSSIFILLLSTALNFHVTIMFIFPIALASIYYDPKVNRLALVLAVVSSTAGKILAYVLVTVVDNNYHGFTSLLLHNCFPQILMLGSIGYIFVALGKKNNKMLSSLMDAEEQEKMLLHMQKLSEKSSEVSMGLVNKMETLNTVTNSTIDANNEISENTGIIIEGINSSMEQLQVAEGNTSRIYENIQVLSQESEEVAGLFTNVETLSNQNRTYMQKVTEGMVLAAESTSVCQEAMSKLEQKTKKIDGIVDVIAEISEQTDLLSLNAAIESARAGEQGKGFAIVAEEIRKLSQQTQNTLVDVRSIIGEVLEQNIIAVEAMSQTTNVHDEQKEAIVKAEDSSKMVMEATKNMADKMQLILRNTRNIEKSASKIVEIVNSITTICKENQVSLEVVSESVQSGITTTSQLEELVTDIRAMADELAGVVQE